MVHTKGARRPAFTLVELLVVIGIIGVLLGILLPALSTAQEQGRMIKCASNLRNIGNGLAIYCSDNKGVYPPAYIYAGQVVTTNPPSQTPTSAVNGYVHWSSYLYGARGSNTGKETVAADSFMCPAFENGGLTPTNPGPDGDLDAGQEPENAGVADQQVPRLAYTVNEALCPRNKWVLGFQGAVRVYKVVNAGSVKRSMSTVLATELQQNWRIVSGGSRGGGGGEVCKSHRPVHGFRGLTGGLDMDGVPGDAFGRGGTYSRVGENDLSKDPKPGETSGSRLDWVGRNHGRKVIRGGWDERKTNFLYADNHVETKHVRDTVGRNFEWGDLFYSLSPNGDIQR